MFVHSTTFVHSRLKLVMQSTKQAKTGLALKWTQPQYDWLKIRILTYNHYSARRLVINQPQRIPRCG